VAARFERVVRGYGASIDSVHSINKAETICAALVVHTITAGRGLYYFEMRGDGHALAVEHGAGVCRPFDGNEGHFVV
jgi:hypothetical protein